MYNFFNASSLKGLVGFDDFFYLRGRWYLYIFLRGYKFFIIHEETSKIFITDFSMCISNAFKGSGIW